jgi:sporulation-control protein spo0M
MSSTLYASSSRLRLCNVDCAEVNYYDNVKKMCCLRQEYAFGPARAEQRVNLLEFLNHINKLEVLSDRTTRQELGRGILSQIFNCVG